MHGKTTLLAKAVESLASFFGFLGSDLRLSSILYVLFTWERSRKLGNDAEINFKVASYAMNNTVSGQGGKEEKGKKQHSLLAFDVATERGLSLRLLPSGPKPRCSACVAMYNRM